MAELKDSGERRDFGTGAVRDAAEGKGRCDLLPLTVVGKLLDSEELKLISKFKESKNSNFLLEAVRVFSFKTNIDLPTIIMEVSKQFEDGAKKYAENNWMKGIPLHCYIDSGTRHFLKFLRGDTDEPHDRAFVWNMICAAWTIDNKPNLDDIEKDLPKKENENEKVNEPLIVKDKPYLPFMKYNETINKPHNYCCHSYNTCSLECGIYDVCQNSLRKEQKR